MIRIMTFWLAPLTLAAALQLHQQHTSGDAWEPQRQAVATLAAEFERVTQR